MVLMEANKEYTESELNRKLIAELNPFRYRGYYFDTETNLYYLNSRYYDPEICRFVNADSLNYLNPNAINGLNLYNYCGNNPIYFVDYSGKFEIANIVNIFKTINTINLIDNSIISTLFGNASVYISYNEKDKDYGLFYETNEMSISDGVLKQSLGINLFDVVRADINLGLGINGLNIGIGVNAGNYSGGVNVNIGFGTLALVAVAVVAAPAIVGVIAEAATAVIYQIFQFFTNLFSWLH